jgi:two-component system, NarL family, sensor histidine kinase BarA
MSLKHTIAVVEDNPDNRLLLRALLEPRYDIQEYENGVIALEQMPQQKPDLVLMDISLPHLSGVEVLAKMRESEALKDIPVISVTAHAMSGDREKYLGYGFNDYLAKPIWDENQLYSTIDKHLS